MIIPNSCIFYLVNEQEVHLARLESSLKCLKKNFLKEHPYPVVLGHEGLSAATKDRIRKVVPDTHYFHKVEFSLPDYSKDILDKIPEKFKGHWDENAFFSMGYRHMCRLFSGGLYKDKFFDNVKYIMRLDCDSYITDKITQDPFKVMADKEAIYGYVGEEEDMDYVIEDCEWFRTGPYMKFFDEIDKTGNIYIKRWGDAPIKYQGVMRLVPKDKRIKFDLPYKHGGDL